MFIACTEKCIYQKDGICLKNDCITQNEYISGTVSCPHFEPIPNKTKEKTISQAASKDHKHFSEV